MSTWAVWAIEDDNGSPGKIFWAETIRNVTLVEAGNIAELQMWNKRWWGIGLRSVGGIQGGKWKYLSMRDGPTDFSLLKPARKKKEDWPKLCDPTGLPMEIESRETAIKMEAAKEREAVFWEKHGKGKAKIETLQ